MRNTFSLFLLLLINNAAFSQPWMPKGKGPVKFADVVAAYERQEHESHEFESEDEHGKVVEEDENYQFDRWCWYWKQHLDTAGYIVQNGTAITEWNNYRNSLVGVAGKTTSAANWIFQGPDHSNGGYSGLGRINVVAFDPVDSNTIYAGSAAGSTWKSTDGGASWVCLYDNIVTLSVSDIKVNPLNGNTIYVATGDGDASDNYSTGIIKSVDGGTTWTNIGPNWTPDSMNLARSLIINPIDTNKLVLGSSAGLFKSSDGGVTWVKTSSNNFRQVLFAPFDTSVVYGTIEGWSGSAQIVQSADGGFTWTTVTSFTNARRINLAVTPAGPNAVRAIAANFENGLLGFYNSYDYGLTYLASYTNDAACTQNLLSYDLGLPSTACGGQGWYDLCIAADPVYPTRVVIGGINNYFSGDAGMSWEIANQWYDGVFGLQVVHADKHWLGYNPLTNALFLGCDGGIYKTYQPLGGKWIDLTNGMGITQFYRNAVDNGASFCLGGAQDNGSKMVDGATERDLTGGDGMQCLINYIDPENMFYCAYQNGFVDITDDAGGHFRSITEDLPTPGAWITPYLLHPSNPATLLIGYKAVYVSYDNGGSWTTLSPVFNSFSDIEILSIGMADPNYVYAVRDNGPTSKIHYTPDFGATWSTIPGFFTNYISDLVVDPLDSKHIWVTLSGYGPVKVSGYDLSTGLWTDESAGLPNVPVNCMAVDTFSQTRYVGTDLAVFYKTTTMASWELFNDHLPAVIIRDLNINHKTNEIWAATYGRGMWKSLKAELTPSSVPWNNFPVETISLSPNPCHESVTISSSGLSFRNAPVSVRFTTVDGKTMQTATGVFDNTGKLKIRLEGLSPGMYFCEVSNAKGLARNKLVVY